MSVTLQLPGEHTIEITLAVALPVQVCGTARGELSAGFRVAAPGIDHGARDLEAKPGLFRAGRWDD